jgi:hypothetical protein
VRYILPISLLFVVATAFCQTSLESFQRDAEKALGRTITITETDDVGSNNGETYCDRDPVLIRVRPGLVEDLRQQVLAHELGHAILCGRGIFSVTVSTDGPSSIAGSIGARVGSCYIDPLADAEAEKRGFKPAQTVDEILRKSLSHSKKEFRDFLENYKELAVDSITLAIYCTDLRPHSFQISEMEASVSGESDVMTKLQALRRDFGKPKCFDGSSCFVLTKRLRDELALQKLVVVKNPTTGLFE